MAKPTKEMAKLAEKALEQRKFFGQNKPMTSVGVARARDISNMSDLSVETMKRMHSFLKRHEKNYNPGKKDSKGRNTPGTISYWGWGGLPGLRWVVRELKKIGEL